MTSFVADNSVIVAWALDEGSDYADRVLERVRVHRPIVPSVWPLEFANVLAVAERKDRLSGPDPARARDLVLSLGITVVPEPPGRVSSEVLALAREEGISSYDASYLDLAIREGLPLATLDARLRAASLRKGVLRFAGE
ncbi:type II toxin-antitoxin system VapC family toxin [Myxococcota bacterium]|nr:type II toxin-antitoxin system VapC family toxin [Myxococcota bacterium]